MRITSKLILSLILGIVLFGCSSTSNTTSGDPSGSASLPGTWALKSIQCVSVSPRSQCWKALLIPLGAISMDDKSTTLLTLGADGTFSCDEVAKIDSLPKSIFNCQNEPWYNFYPVGAPNEHVEGTYSAVTGNLIVKVSKYTIGGNNRERGIDVPAAGTYSISGSTMTATLTLGDGETWKAILTK